MAELDKDLIGNIINALPLDKMIAAPLQAMIRAQVTASKTYADFLMGVCVEDGKAVAIAFDYDESVTDERGAYQGTVSKSVRIPLLAAITHPSIAIDEGTIDFELEVSQAFESATATDVEAGLNAELGWGPFKVTVKGSVTHNASQTRKTDTRARYRISTRVSRQAPPEAMMRVIDLLTEAAAKPVAQSTPNGRLTD